MPSLYRVGKHNYMYALWYATTPVEERAAPLRLWSGLEDTPAVSKDHSKTDYESATDERGGGRGGRERKRNSESERETQRERDSKRARCRENDK
eukprot:2268490-Pleurochrysis_carterae.AAC.1